MRRSLRPLLKLHVTHMPCRYNPQLAVRRPVAYAVRQDLDDGSLWRPGPALWASIYSSTKVRINSVSFCNLPQSRRPSLGKESWMPKGYKTRARFFNRDDKDV